MTIVKQLQHVLIHLLSLSTHITYIHARPSRFGTQYILYTGYLSGTYTLPPSDPPSNCSHYQFLNQPDTNLYIGVNPPWDANPLYFAFERFGPFNDQGPCSRMPTGACTEVIRQLEFVSVEFECFKGEQEQEQENGEGGQERCDGREIVGGEEQHFLPFQRLDLAKAGIAGKRVRGENGYSVEGDQGSFAQDRIGDGNAELYNSFGFRPPGAWSSGENAEYDGWELEPRCDPEMGWVQFQWNDTARFTYNIDFTNNSARASLLLAAPAGTVTFQFSDFRVDYDDAKPQDTNDVAPHPFNLGQFTPIALNTSDPEVPRFMFANGTAFEWMEDGKGQWHAVAVEAAPSSAPAVRVYPLPGPIGVALGFGMYFVLS